MAESTETLFDEYAERYDRWFDRAPGRLQFAGEADALGLLLQDVPKPWLEIGVGTGRFGARLGVELGLDPSRPMLLRARKRQVSVAQGVGEQLPVRDGALGSVLLVTALCFVADPVALLSEARRTLRVRGAIVVGEIVAGSPWADQYEQQGREGHALYSQAHFRSLPDLHDMLQAAGFTMTDHACSLLQPPTRVREAERGWWGFSIFSSFAAVRAIKV